MKPVVDSQPCQVPGAAALAERVHALQDFYRHVQTERMQGVPLLNRALEVQALGFAWLPGTGHEPAVAEGVLITPWFMSLLRLPAPVQGHEGRVGLKHLHPFGNQSFEFIGAHDPTLGFHEACALFSPMGAFADQQQAVDTAAAVLAQLRAVPAQAAATTAAAEPMPLPMPAPLPSRRAFFAGRRSEAERARP